MARLDFYLKIITLIYLFIVFSEQCNVGFGNLGFGNVGIGNVGYGNKGLFNKGFENKGVLNKGFMNIGVLNRKSANTIGVANFFQLRRIGVGSVITVPNFLPAG